MHGRRWVLAWVVAAYTVYHAPLAPFPNVIKMRPGGVLPVKTANSDCICMHTPWPVGEVSRCPKIPGCNLSSAMDSFLLPQPSARRKRPHNWDTRYRVFPLISFAWRLTLATTDRWRHEIVAKPRHFFFHPGCFRATLDARQQCSRKSIYPEFLVSSFCATRSPCGPPSSQKKQTIK